MQDTIVCIAAKLFSSFLSGKTPEHSAPATKDSVKHGATDAFYVPDDDTDGTIENLEETTEEQA